MPVPYDVPFDIGAEGGFIHVEQDRAATIPADLRGMQPTNERSWAVLPEDRTISEEPDE